MNKSELIDAIAADAGISKEAAKKALNSFTENVTSVLSQHLRELQEQVSTHKLKKKLKLLLKQ